MSRSTRESQARQQETVGTADQPQRDDKQACSEIICEAAYYKWQAAGCPSGDGVEFWLEAEADVLTNTSGVDKSQNQ